MHKVQLFFKIVEFDLLSIFTGPLLSIQVRIHHAICQVICQYHQYMKQFTKKIFCRVVNVKCIGLQYIYTTKWQLLSSIYCHPVNYKFTTWRFPHLTVGEKDNRNRNNKEIYGQLIYLDHFFIFYFIKDTLFQQQKNNNKK